MAPRLYRAERPCLAAMSNPTTTCGLCGSAAVVTGTDGTIRRRASEPPFAHHHRDNRVPEVWHAATTREAKRL